MTPEEERAIHVTLDALTRLMNLFRLERLLYLFGAVAGLGLAFWAVSMWLVSGKADATQLGLMFGASGIIAATSGRVAYFLNRSFDLVEVIIRKLTGAAA